MVEPLCWQQTEQDSSDSDEEEGLWGRRHSRPVGVIQLRRREGPAFTKEEFEGYYLVARTALMAAVHAGALQRAGDHVATYVAQNRMQVNQQRPTFPD